MELKFQFGSETTLFASFLVALRGVVYNKSFNVFLEMCGQFLYHSHETQAHETLHGMQRIVALGHEDTRSARFVEPVSYGHRSI